MFFKVSYLFALASFVAVAVATADNPGLSSWLIYVLVVTDSKGEFASQLMPATALTITVKAIRAPGKVVTKEVSETTRNLYEGNY